MERRPQNFCNMHSLNQLCLVASRQKQQMVSAREINISFKALHDIKIPGNHQLRDPDSAVEPKSDHQERAI